MTGAWLLPGVLALTAGVVGAESPASSSTVGWTELLRSQLTRYPLADAHDVYKFIHQSVYGPAHAIRDPEAARRYLVEELATLSPARADEPLVERLSETPPLARVNLRPYIAAGGSTERLLDAFVETAAEVHGDPHVMTARLEAAVELLRGLGRLNDADALASLTATTAAAGYPAGHHSAAFTDAYRPAYRVLDPRLLPTPAAPVASSP